jgi:nitrogenase molybdenum-iron protein alpha/beta subunit
VRQTEIHTAVPLVLELSAFEVEMAIDKLKGHKSPGIDQIPAKLIKARGRTIRSEIRKLLLVLYGKRRNCLGSGRSQSLYLSIRMMINQIVVIIEAYHFSQLHIKFYPTSGCQG